MRTARLALAFTIAVAPAALAQTKAELPTARGPNSGSLLDRRGPTPLNREHASPVPRVPVRAVVGRPGFVGSPVIVTRPAVVDESGLRVEGRFTDSKLDLRFHLGGPHFFGPGRIINPDGRVILVPSYGWGGSAWYRPRWDRYGDEWWYDNRYRVIDGAIIQSPYVVSMPEPQPEPASVEPPTLAEQAAAELRGGRASRSIDLFQQSITEEGEDPAVARALAVALLEAKRFDEAAAVMAMTYRNDPALALDRLDAEALFTGAGDLRAAVRAAVNHANRVKTSAAWLTVAVLMQAEGRDDHALRMIERAAGLGLDERVVARFRSALIR